MYFLIQPMTLKLSGYLYYIYSILISKENLIYKINLYSNNLKTKTIQIKFF